MNMYTHNTNSSFSLIQTQIYMIKACRDTYKTCWYVFANSTLKEPFQMGGNHQLTPLSALCKQLGPINWIAFAFVIYMSIKHSFLYFEKLIKFNMILCQ